MKTRPSKLDPHAEKIREWELANRTLEQMAADLAALGCEVSLGRLSSYLARQRRERTLRESRTSLFGMIADGTKSNRELDKVFAENPAPELNRLVQVTKALVLDLKIQAVQPDGTLDAQKIEIASSLFREITEVLKLDAKRKDQELDERKIAVMEKKASAFDQVKAAVNQGGITPETLTKIERELKLL